MSAPPCPRPLDLARIVDYLAGESGDDADAVEEHLMGCSRCAGEIDRALGVVRAVRGMLPPVISAAQVAELRAAGLAVEENAFAPGARTEVTFGPGVDFLIHHLAGLDLARAERVHVTVRVEGSGEVLADDHFAPFDAERGEVLIACQRHFAFLPPDIQFDVEVHAPGAPVVVATYRIPHLFDAS